jgi:predicted dehydrogenase
VFHVALSSRPLLELLDTQLAESATHFEIAHDKVTKSMPHNIALIGCGAIAQTFYLPALAKHRAKFGRFWCVDPGDRARFAAASTLNGEEARTLSDACDDIHLAIIATPNALHFPLAYEALSRRADVLIEKPFVIYPVDGRRLAEIAAANKRVIAINQTRRFLPFAQPLRRQIEAGAFGCLKSIVHREGTKLKWPFESGSGFARGAQRTGVIMDFGVHVIDLYHYLLQPRWTLVSAIHDGFQGPEGLVEIELQADTSPVSIRLSRYHEQENVARLTFEGAEVSFHVYGAGPCSIRWNSGHTTTLPEARADAANESPAEQLLLDFLAASEERKSAVCGPSSSLPVIDILDEIYRSARHYPATLGYV